MILPERRRSGSRAGRRAVALVALTVASRTDNAPTHRCPARQVAVPAVENREGVPIAAAPVQGRPAAVIVDTGTQTSTFPETAVDRLDLDVSPTHSYLIHAINRSFAAPAATARRASLGAAVIRHVPLAIAGDYALARHGIVVDGLLGTGLLSRCDVDLDLPRDRIGLYEKAGCAPVPPSADGEREGLAFGGGDDRRAMMRIVVNGHAAAALLDSGAQQTILAQGAIEAAPVHPTPMSGHDTVATGIDGLPVRLRLLSLASLQIGPVRQTRQGQGCGSPLRAGRRRLPAFPPRLDLLLPRPDVHHGCAERLGAVPARDVTEPQAAA